MKKVKRYFVVYTGVFGRNRTTKTDVKTLLESDSAVDIETVRAKLNEFIASVKFKSAYKYVVKENDFEIEDGMETHMPFNAKVVLSGVGA